MCGDNVIEEKVHTTLLMTVNKLFNNPSIGDYIKPDINQENRNIIDSYNINIKTYP